MNYEEMSDFEINKLVAKYLGFDTGWKAANCSKIGISDGSIFGKYVDYCNNPSDAWPLIIDNKISLFWNGSVFDNWIARTIHTKGIHHINPLRAAMIVFLMMQDHEND